MNIPHSACKALVKGTKRTVKRSYARPTPSGFWLSKLQFCKWKEMECNIVRLLTIYCRTNCCESLMLPNQMSNNMYLHSQTCYRIIFITSGMINHFHMVDFMINSVTKTGISWKSLYGPQCEKTCPCSLISALICYSLIGKNHI